MDKKGLGIAIGVIALFGVLIAAVFFFSSPANPEAQPAALGATSQNPQAVEPTVPETRQVSEGWRGYENQAFRFGLLFPEELNAREYKESGGALSVVFEDPQSGRGFQIYVTPYAETQITEEQFRLDVSSGVMKEPTDVVIGGVRGTMFLSTNAIMGETREVWFINNGFLYEVVTYRELDSWLGTIMQTWKFL